MVNEESEKLEQGYIIDGDDEDKRAYKERKERDRQEQQPMGDVYDVYAKASGVHSKLSGMTEDYTLARYNIDIYNQKLPKFIREQRKVIRIIKSYLILPKEILRTVYNTETKVEEVYNGLLNEYNIVEELLLGELDESVLMSRTPNGEVIKAFLMHGLNQESREQYDLNNEKPTISNKLKERDKQ